jgi:hypothetical protein
MAKILDHLFGMITHPAKTTRSILLGKPFTLSSIVFVGFLVSLLTSQWFQHNMVWMNRPMSFFEIVPLEIISIVAVLVVGSSLFHLTADFLGGGGRGMNLFFLIQISLLPLWLYGMLNILFSLLLKMQLLSNIAAAVLFFWSLVLMIISIRELYRFTIFRACVTIFLPLLFVFAIGSIVAYVIFKVSYPV